MIDDAFKYDINALYKTLKKSCSKPINNLYF